MSQPAATAPSMRMHDPARPSPDSPTYRHYEPVPYWAMVPHGMGFAGDATSVTVTSDQLVHVFNRGDDPLMVFTTEGEFVSASGRGEFERPHSVRRDREDNLYLVDDFGHQIQKRTTDGKVLFTKSWERPAPEQSGRPFNRPTDIAIRPSTGELYVSDGYKNSRIHILSPDGEYLSGFGTSGSHPGEFSLPHNLTFVGDDRLLVCDRENHRIQFFSPEGDWLESWHAHHPCCVFYDVENTGLLYVGEMPPRSITGQMTVEGLGARVKVFALDGTIVGEFGGPVKGLEPDRFISPHGISVDKSGAVYIAEVSGTNLLRDGKVPVGHEAVSLRKWVLRS